VNAPIADSDRFWHIADAVCAGTASDEELHELEARVVADENIRSLYIAYCQLHSALGLELRGQRAGMLTRETIRTDVLTAAANDFPDGMPTSHLGIPVAPAASILSSTLHGMVGYLPEGLPFAYLVATVLVGIGLLIGSLVHVSQPTQVVKDSLPPVRSVAEPEMEFVGRITGMVDCQWETEGLGIRGWGLEKQSSKVQGSRRNQSLIPNGQSIVTLGDKFALSSGLLEITYDTGAKVILQGPVTYDVESRTGGFLSAGRLTARVEKRSETANRKSETSNPQSLIPNPSLSTTHYPLFTIKTPTATVTDLGTEFGVEVKQDGTSRICVLQGLISVSTGQVAKTQELRAGQAVQIDRPDKDGQARIIAVAPRTMPRFVRHLRDVDPRAYMKAVLADKPFAYWTFDESVGAAFEQVRHLANQRLDPSGNADRCLHAAIGSGLALGRAVDFSQVAGCFRSPLMDLGHMPGAWAIEFWVQFTGDSSGRTNQCIMTTGEETKHGLRNPAVMAVPYGDSADRELALYAIDMRTGAGPRIADHRWHHVILVFYGNAEDFGVADRVDMLVDGQSRTVERGEFTSGLNMEGRLTVGAAADDLANPLQGRIDELAFYDLNGLTVAQIESKVARMASEHRAAAQAPGRAVTASNDP
jgi:hypothetical protein